MVVFEANGRPALRINGGTSAQLAETLEWGQRLAETPIGVEKGKKNGLWEARGWKELVQHMPAHKQATAAIMLENCRAANLDETTRAANLGTFDKWIFPVLANMSENDVIDQLVALQPMPGPVSQVVYVDIVTGRSKGNVPAGSPVWRALQGAVDRYSDSDEIVESETLGVVSGGALSATTQWVPLRAGEFTVTDGSSVATDDGNGNIVASGNITGGTVNYVTGAVTLTTTSGDNGDTIYATYAFNSEANVNIQEYDVKLTSSPVTAKVRKLKTRWTEEANQNLQAMYNIKAESILITAITNALQYQKHREVIMDIRNRADAGYVEWNATPPANVNYQAHKYSAVDAIETAKNFIFLATNQARGNWILTGVALATVIVTLPQFTPKNNGAKMQGITYIGDLGDCKVFSDPHFPVNEFVVGFKGDQFLNTGYVLAEYQKLYTTPDITLPDFVHQRGFATSYARKFVNSKFYCRGAVVNAPTAFGPVIG